MKRTVRIPPNLLEDRLDARYNAPAAVEVRQKLSSCGLPTSSVISLFKDIVCGPFGSTLTADEHSINGEVLLIQPTNINSELFSLDSIWRITERKRQEKNLTLYPEETFLFARVGVYPHVGVLPAWVGFATIGSSMIAGIPSGQVDSYYLLAFFRTQYGQPLLLAAQKITAQPTIGTDEIGSTVVLKPDPLAQTYIGDKVRQAERLRERSRELADKVNFLTLTSDIQEALNVQDLRFNQPKAKDLEPRLDAKFYNWRTMKVLKACSKNSISIRDLIISVSNGFEYRNFVDEGLPYVTVSEVSSGRINLANAPQIPSSVRIPNKARIHSHCVLVVRTGSIGIAAKVYEEDKYALISSHLIRLEFKEESTAGAVAGFLNSQAGTCLLHKISYGAVQPQIGQDEVLSLPIPKAVFENAEDILLCLNSQEQAIRNSERLTAAAKFIVEALIEGNLKEAELKAAQEAIQQGDNSLDREILLRLTRKGYNISGESPLFPDLHTLYKALQEVETNQEVE